MANDYVTKSYLTTQFQNYSGVVKDTFAKKTDVDVEKLEYTNAEDSSITNVKNALDILFESGSGGGELEAELKPNVTMGSLKTSYPIGTSFEEILRDMLTEKVPPTISMTLNPSTTLYDEVNDIVSSLTIGTTTTKKTNNIAKVEIYINNTLVRTSTTNVENGGSLSYTYDTEISDDVTIKAVVTDTEGLSSTATKTITFIANSYYGIVDATTGEPGESLIKTLNKNLKNTKKLSYSGITCDYNKIVYAYPSELGKLTSIMDKVNNFNYTASFQLTTKTVDEIEYYVYTLIEPTGADNVTLTFE